LQKKFLYFLFLVSTASFCAVNDVVPTDYVATKPNSTYLTVYSYSKLMDGPYAKKQKLTADSVSSNIAVLRITHSVIINNYMVSPMVIIPYAVSNSHGQTLPSAIGKTADGFADLRFGATTWVKNDDANKEYIGITTTVAIPSGKYDKKQSLNVGEDRYKAILSAGYVKRVINNDTGEFFVEISPEIAYYWASKDQYARTVVQKPTYALTEYIRYRPQPSYSVFIGAQQNFGGETLVNGTPQDNEPKAQKLMVGGALFVFDTQLMLRYGRDVSIQSGFRTKDEFLLRIQKRF
jgi:hypothetical protein